MWVAVDLKDRVLNGLYYLGSGHGGQIGAIAELVVQPLQTGSGDVVKRTRFILLERW
ncbi:hypothetical protein D3C71_2151060 [compost metagenome]